MIQTRAVKFNCRKTTLHGILDVPQVIGTRAVVVIVGGPQYRIGSHRQFVLLSRHLAKNGVPTLRFDHRGVGDSDGEVTFESMGPDIEAAVDCLCAELSTVREVILWGLCDAASAAMMYAASDSRVKGLILVNPWFRDEKSQAQTFLKHYYLAKLTSGTFWRQLLSGRLQIISSMKSFLVNIKLAILASDTPETRKSIKQGHLLTYRKRMEVGLRDFRHNVLFILSGDDLTASEFKSQIADNSAWTKILCRESVCRHDLAESNHTFSRKEWRHQVEIWCSQWISSW